MKTDTPEADAACGLPSHDWIKTAERLYECAKKLERERDAARAECAWQPIETAPKDGRALLLCWAIDADGNPIEWDKEPETAGVFIQVASWQSDHWNVYIDTPSDARLHFEPTHWMPIPKAPKP